jgi:trimethylamine--corrinoid protein Co-methyltransferase
MVTKTHLTVWGEDDCRRLHAATLDLLADTGVEVMYEPALQLLQAAGCEANDRRVRIPARLVDEAVAKAPREWLLKPRGGDTEPLVLRDGEMYFGTGSDVLYTRDPDTGERRRVRLADVERMAALCEQLPNIDFVMSMGLPEDLPRELDDIGSVAAMLRGTRKPLIVAPRDGTVLARIQEMAALCGEKESFAIYSMPSPPLQHDPDALTKVVACAELRIPLIYCPAPNAGATGPRSVAGVVLVGNAEALSGLVLHQLVSAGAPFVYGAGGGVMDMRTMTDPYTAPENATAMQCCCDLARFYGLPSFSYAADSDSKTLDEQWSAEAALTTMVGALSRATLLHDVGYLESGLQSSCESIVLGDELAGYARAFVREAPVNDETLALDEIKAVGPGGSFLGTKYTRRHYREFWMSDLFDHSVHDRWAADGEKTLKQRVQARVAALRAAEKPFALTSEQEAGLEAILAEVQAHESERI